MTQIADYKSIFTLPTKSWTLEEYHAMIEAGILTSDDKVELLFGQIVEMNPVGRAHGTTVNKINRYLQRRFIESELVIGVQNPITLVDESEPEPDVFIATGPLEKYLEHHPYPEDLLLVIEVSDSTLPKDRGAKKVNYAIAGIQEYWVIDVYGRKLHRYTEPDQVGRSYLKEETYSESDTINSFSLGEFALDDLLVQYP